MRSKSGIAIVATLVILVLVGLLVFGTFYTTQIEQFVTRNDSTSTQANYIAQAGLQKYKTALFQNFRWALQNLTPTSLNACENVLSGGIDWDRGGSNSPQNFPVTFTEQIGGGTARVTISRDSRRPRFMIITSEGNFSGARSRIRAVFDISNAGLFRYGLVIGQGSGQQVITGSPRIYGGVFIEGPRPNPNPPSPPPTVLTGSGNMTALNTFNLATNAEGDLRNLQTRSAVTSDNDLCASFRVRWGRVGVQSNSFGLGQPNPSNYNPATDPNNQLLDIRVGDQRLAVNESRALLYQANSLPNNPVIYDQNCDNNGGLCAQSIGRYDLSDSASPRFPRLDEPGNPQLCGVGVTWRSCLRSDAQIQFVATGQNPIALPPLPTGWQWVNESRCRAFLSGSQPNITLSQGRNAAQNTNLSFDCTYRTPETGFNPAGGFAYDAATRTLRVYGTANLLGFNIVTDGQINYQAFGFGGVGRSASLFLERSPTTSQGGSFTLAGNFVPDSETQFPTQNLSLIADENITYTNNQMTVMGVIYAENRFVMSGSQSSFVGTAIANEFCTQDSCGTGGSPSLFFVDTSSNLPSAMLRAPYGQIASFSVISYERF
jgi:Tfp pilus assembly protein PilX